MDGDDEERDVTDSNAEDRRPPAEPVDAPDLPPEPATPRTDSDGPPTGPVAAPTGPVAAPTGPIATAGPADRDPAGDDEHDSARHALARPAPVPPAPGLELDPATRQVPTVAAPFAEPPAVVPGPGHVVPELGGRASGSSATPVPSAGPGPAAHRGDPVTGPAAAVPDGSAAAVPPLGAPAPVPPTGEPGYDFPDPHPPRAPGAGSHILGVLVGLVLAPAGAVALLLGQSRVLVVQTDQWDGSVEWLGIALVAVGTVLLVSLVLLASWTAAAPVTGGGVLTVLGAVALAAPGLTHTQVLALLDSEGWHATIQQTVVAATSGTLLAVGALLLAAGLSAAATRRRGLRLGAFRERNLS